MWSDYFKVFKVIKEVSYVYVKLMFFMFVFIFINYLRYVYFSVGITMTYGVVFLVALCLLSILWLIRAVKDISHIIGHFLPLGVTGVLKVFIPLIELLGVIIRPITLAVRLATNISCGHVVLLIFSYFVITFELYLFMSVGLLLLGLFFIEFLVCAIQAYVFWSLLYIYIIEIEI